MNGGLILAIILVVMIVAFGIYGWINASEESQATPEDQNVERIVVVLVDHINGLIRPGIEATWTNTRFVADPESEHVFFIDGMEFKTVSPRQDGATLRFDAMFDPFQLRINSVPIILSSVQQRRLMHAINCWQARLLTITASEDAMASAQMAQEAVRNLKP